MATKPITLLALAAWLVCFATNVAFADEAEKPAPPAALETSTPEAIDDQVKRTYTWEELVELIPDIKEMKIVYPKKKRRRGRNAVASVDEVAPQPMLCRLESRPSVASRIKRRRCFTLDEYIADYIEARQTYADMLAGGIASGYIESGSVLVDGGLYPVEY